MNNKLSQNFNSISLFKFTAPTTIMLVFISLYQMVDAVFVSNFVGENALSALNIIYPVPSIIIAIAIMLATGGSAIVAKNMGEGKSLEAKQNFSLIAYVGIAISIVCLVLGIAFIDPIIRALGATDILYQYCYDYLFIIILSFPLAVLQMLFQNFFVTAGKPHLGLTLTIIGALPLTLTLKIIRNKRADIWQSTPTICSLPNTQSLNYISRSPTISHLTN